MKFFCLTTSIAVILLFCYNGMQAQKVTPDIDQLKLAHAFVGTWQYVRNKDTIEVSEVQQYGKAFIVHAYLVINGKKSFYYEENYGFSLKEGKFKGFMLWPGGDYQTWLGSFITEKKFSLDFVQDFNPGTLSGKVEIELETPTNMISTWFNTAGVKTGEYKSFKVK
jgi:hypothetical protein